MRVTGRQSKTQNVCLGVDVARDFVHEIKWEIREVHEEDEWRKGEEWRISTFGGENFQLDLSQRRYWCIAGPVRPTQKIFN